MTEMISLEGTSVPSRSPLKKSSTKTAMFFNSFVESDFRQGPTIGANRKCLGSIKFLCFLEQMAVLKLRQLCGEQYVFDHPFGFPVRSSLRNSKMSTR
jgi:hypothetical protein